MRDGGALAQCSSATAGREGACSRDDAQVLWCAVFGGGDLLPDNDRAEMNANLQDETPDVVAAIAESSAPYLTRHGVVDAVPLLRAASFLLCNTSLLLGWASGLHEINNQLRAIALRASSEPLRGRCCTIEPGTADRPMVRGSA